MFLFFMIIVDGSFGEGGGSMLRQSLALSIYTGKPFKIKNIRLNRKKPGLSNQHLASIYLAQKVCNAKVVGARRGSFELEFYPGEIVSRNIEVDIGSAGSIFLALQSVFLPCLLSGKKFIFTIKGGTDVAWSPGFDYFKNVFLPFFEDIGEFDCRLFRRGYYPKGNGKISLKIRGKNNAFFSPLNLVSIGKLISIRGESNASMDLEKINFADEEADNAITLLKDYDVPITINRTYSEADSTGSGLLVYGFFEQNQSKIFRTGIFRVSPKMKRDVSLEVVEEFKKLIKDDVPVCEFLADQLISFLAVTGGKIKTTPIDKHLSEHLVSNIYVVELFFNKKIETHKEGLIICK